MVIRKNIQVWQTGVFYGYIRLIITFLTSVVFFTVLAQLELWTFPLNDCALIFYVIFVAIVTVSENVHKATIKQDYSSVQNNHFLCKKR